MANRTTKVSLVAEVSGYVAGMEKAARTTREVGSEAEKLGQKKAAIAELGAGLLAIGAVAAVGVGLAVARFAEFDAAMSNVQAVTQETSGNMGLLREAALEMGASSVFTATEAANAIEELGKAGLATADILGGGLKGALDLASAGELGIARAAEIAATTMSQFGLAGSDAAQVADVLAAGAGKALGSVDDLANGLKFVGPVAAAMGVSLEETTGVLALFAQQGIIGEQAGTALRGMLSSLTSPSKIAQKEIEKLGITLYDQEGAFLGVENAAGQLKGAYSGMTDEQRDFSLGVLFGNEQVTAARILYAEGAEGVREWTGAVDESGYAAQVARDRLDNLQGDVEALGGAFDTFLIKSGSTANDTLRTLTQSLTFLVDAAGDIPAPVLGVGMAIGTVAAAVALTGGAALTIGPKLLEMRTALHAVGLTARGTAIAVGLVGSAIAAATLIIGLHVASQAKAKAAVDALRDSLDAQTGAMTDATRATVAKRLEDEGVFEAAKKAGIGLDVVTDAALGNKAAIEEVTAATKEWYGEKTLGDRVLGDSAAYDKLTNNVRFVREGLDDAKDSFRDNADAAAESADTTGTAAEAYQDAATDVADLESELSGLIDTMNAANGVGQDAVSQNIAYQDALFGVDEQIRQAREGVDGFSLGVDQNTKAGRDNTKMLVDLASQSQDAAKAQFDLDGNTADYRATLENGRAAVIDRARQLGATADEAENLADKIYAIPSEKEFTMIAETQAAQAAVDRFITRNDGRRFRVFADQSVQAVGSSLIARASGGILPGAPSSRDNMLIAAASGEYVVNAAATMRNRALLEAINAGRGYAGGGYVQPQRAQYTPSMNSSQPVDVRVELVPHDSEFGRAIDARVFVNNEQQTTVLQNGRRRL